MAVDPSWKSVLLRQNWLGDGWEKDLAIALWITLCGCALARVVGGASTGLDGSTRELALALLL
jgi:hypothetical protein